jgi:putative peptidoglycan binding protein/D-alanyl-D-alanine carboxypeptidase-like protein
MAPRPGTHSWREWAWGSSCHRASLTTVYWMLGARKITCDKRAVGAFRALGRVFWKHGYAIRDEVTGVYACRMITGGSVPSSHAWGTAIDTNWDTNPYRRDKLVTDIPYTLREEVEAMRTLRGDKVWRWGGDWDGRPDTAEGNYDAMHWEIVATPDQLVKAFDVPQIALSTLPIDRRTWALLGVGERGPAVAQLQRLLQIEPADGIFGPNTEKALKDYQAARAITVDGVVGLGTWTALLSRQPEFVDGVPHPYKRKVA